MIISDLEILEVVEVANVQGGIVTRSYNQFDNVDINFDTSNFFATFINDPDRTNVNSAAAGAKGDAQNNTFFPTYSYTKADTLAVTEYLGGSFSASTSAALVNRI